MPPCPLHPPDPAATLGPAPRPCPIPWAAAHTSPAVGAQGTGAVPRTAASSSLCWEGSRQTLLSNKLIKQLSPHLKLAKHYKAHFLPGAFFIPSSCCLAFPGHGGFHFLLRVPACRMDRLGQPSCRLPLVQNLISVSSNPRGMMLCPSPCRAHQGHRFSASTGDPKSPP